MQRTYIPEAMPWFARSMSYIQTLNVESAEAFLRSLPPVHLFGGAKDSDAQNLWRISYDALDHPFSPAVYTVKSLEEQVLDRLPDEALFLSQNEYLLLQRLMTQNGAMLVINAGELLACASLVRRLWCYPTFQGDGSIALHMPETVIFALNKTFSQPMFLTHSAQLADFLSLTDAILLDQGILPFTLFLSEMRSRLFALITDSAHLRHLVMAGFDYTYFRGEMVLIHPGVYDPTPLFPKLEHYPMTIYSMNPESDMDEWDTVTDLSLMLTGLCQNAVRKDMDAQDIASDVVILCKQGAPEEALIDTVASQLIIQPTQAMVSCVQLMHSHIRPWPEFLSGGGS